MASTEPTRPPVVVSGAARPARPRPQTSGLAVMVSRVLWALGLIFLFGSLADLFVLWGLQRIAGNAIWEFQALSQTIEGTPRIVLGVAAILLALHVRGFTSLAAVRAMSAVLLVVGIIGAIIGGMMITDYFALRGSVEPAQMPWFVSIVAKTITLAAIHTFVLIPVGLLGFRRSSSA